METVKDQGAKTSSEFRNLADSRVRPDDRAATGQPLTRMLSQTKHHLELLTPSLDYHSFFYNLLSVWNTDSFALCS